MKLRTLLAPIFAAAVVTGCTTTQHRYDNNNVNRDRFARSTEQRSTGSVPSIQSDASSRRGDSALAGIGDTWIDTDGIHRF